MKIRVEQKGDVAVVKVHANELDVTTHEQFLRDLTPTLEGHMKVLLDFSDVRFVDSSGIGALLYSQRHLEVLGGELGIVNISATVKESFDYLRLGRLVKLYETLDDALAAMDG